MTCFLTVLYVSCALAHSLPGAPSPACEDAPVAVLARVHGSLFEEDADPPWLYEVEPERIPTECGEHPIEILPAATRYPHCVAGHVQRAEVTHGEGEEAVTIPALAPYHGVCCRQGCSLAGPGEVIPIGGPIGYAEERAALYAGPPATEPGGGE